MWYQMCSQHAVKQITKKLLSLFFKRQNVDTNVSINNFNTVLPNSISHRKKTNKTHMEETKNSMVVLQYKKKKSNSPHLSHVSAYFVQIYAV